MVYAVSGKPDSNNMATGVFFKQSEHILEKQNTELR